MSLQKIQIVEIDLIIPPPEHTLQVGSIKFRLVNREADFPIIHAGAYNDTELLYSLRNLDEGDIMEIYLALQYCKKIKEIDFESKGIKFITEYPLRSGYEINGKIKRLINNDVSDYPWAVLDIGINVYLFLNHREIEDKSIKVGDNVSIQECSFMAYSFQPYLLCISDDKSKINYLDEIHFL